MRFSPSGFLGRLRSGALLPLAVLRPAPPWPGAGKIAVALSAAVASVLVGGPLVVRAEAETAIVSVWTYLAGPPTLTSLAASPTSPYAGTASANVTSDNGSAIIERGFVFSRTSDNPTPQLMGPSTTKVVVSGTTGVMTSSLSGLDPSTGYSVQGFATNGDPTDPTGYVGVSTFTTPCPVITLPPLPSGALGAGYFSYVTAVGLPSLGAYNASGAFPPGLILDPSGYIYSTPTAVGSFNFTITVIDLNFPSCFASRNYTMVIDALDIHPRKLQFPSEVVGVPSPPKTVSILNQTASAVGLSLPFVATGPFSVITGCVDPLPAFTACYVDVVYTPTAATVETGTLTIGHNQPLSPIVVSLKGAGTVSAVSQVYVANEFNESVSVIDPVTNLVRTQIGVGDPPGSLAALPGGGKLYVPNYGDGSVYVVDTMTNTLLNTVFDGSFNTPFAVAPTPMGDQVWVVNRSGPSISILRTSDDAVIGVIGGSGCLQVPEGIVANPRNHEMYVLDSNSSSGRVCVFDRVTQTFLRSIPVGGSVSHGVVLPDGSALYVNNGGPAGTAARIALPSGTVTYIAGAEADRMDMKGDGSRIYVAGQTAGFGFIDTATDTFTPIPLNGNGGPGDAFGVTVHDAAGRVYVTDQDHGVVYVVDLLTNTELPNPELPISDSSFSQPRSITSIKPPGPLGTIPTVNALANGTPGFVTAPATATVVADGGLPIFERGFAYSASDTTPEPGEPGVSVLVVPGGPLGAMATTLTGLASGVTNYYQAYAKNLAGTGLSGSGSFLTQTCQSISVSPLSIPAGLVGSPYTATFSSTGPCGEVFDLSVLSGQLPPGITLAVGTISGIPTAAGIYTFEIQATDPNTSCTGSMSYDLVIGSLVAPGDVVISEFRVRGPNGSLDEYVELGNRTSSNIVVLSGDGSGGWSIGRPGESLVTIPDGTLIERGGHWLATGASFSLSGYGSPDPVYGGDGSLLADIPDDLGLALFKTAAVGSYGPATRLDSVGGVNEADALFYEGTPLAELGPTDPVAQTAWVRRLTNAAVLFDAGDNDRDFVFVATDAGDYGPSGDIAAVLGGPNPEDSNTVRDALNSEFSVSLIEPARSPQQAPNREVFPGYAIDYRRAFTNNAPFAVETLAFKVLNLTTTNSRRTLAVQGDLRVDDAPSRNLYVPSLGDFVYVHGTQLDYPSMYSPGGVGGVNSRVIVPSCGEQGNEEIKAKSRGLAFGEMAAVNLRVRIFSPGYYLFVVLPQISEFAANNESFRGPSFHGSCGPPR